MTVTEALRAYVKTCPLLTGARVGIDYLAPEAGAFSLEAAAAPPVVKRYIDGGSLRQFVFVLAARVPFGDHLRQQLTNREFCEAFADWLEEESRSGSLPDLGPERVPRRLEVLSSGAVAKPGVSDARVELRCRLLYETNL